MAKILDGIALRNKAEKELLKKVVDLKRKPTLAILQVGHRKDSDSYIKAKKDFGERIGAEVRHIQFDERADEKGIAACIEALNKDSKCDGIIVQMPIPKHLNSKKIIELIEPDKDVDGLNSKNLALLAQGSSDGMIPATAFGILTMLEEYGVKLSGKHVVVVGRSLLVGKPVAYLCMNNDATVTICHSKTRKLKEICGTADILIAALGRPKFIKKDFVKKGQIVIDAGINPIEYASAKRKIYGDVDFDNVRKIVKAISPVPGGVGPLTVASLFRNLLKASRVK